MLKWKVHIKMETELLNGCSNSLYICCTNENTMPSCKPKHLKYALLNMNYMKTILHGIKLYV